MSLSSELKQFVLDVGGFFVPLFHFVPNSWMFMGFMSMPLIAYFSSTAYIPHLWDEFADMLLDFSFLFEWHGLSELAGVIVFGGLILVARAMIIGGLALLVYSAIHLYGRRDGLVTSGPYARVRHPQYLAIFLMTGGVTFFTFLSSPVWVWAEKSTSLPQVSILYVWALEIVAYLVLADIEELRLASRFGEAYVNYSKSVPFMNPFGGPAGRRTQSGAGGR
jgi:protein-S-isoprenylcysteine O-methyltransferase Ste14